MRPCRKQGVLASRSLSNGFERLRIARSRLTAESRMMISSGVPRLTKTLKPRLRDEAGAEPATRANVPPVVAHVGQDMNVLRASAEHAAALTKIALAAKRH